MRYGRRLGIALLFVTAAVATVADAGISLWPVRFHLTPEDIGTELWVENHSDTRALLQFRLESWSQADGEVRLAPQGRIAISPPFATVPPRARQLVRLVRVAPDPLDRESAYRLRVDEIPDPDRPAEPGVSFRMRYELPVFVAPERRLEPRLSFELEGRRLRIRNDGDAHARITGLGAMTADGSEMEIAPGLVGYVLPDGLIDRDLGVDLPGGAILYLMSNGERVEWTAR